MIGRDLLFDGHPEKGKLVLEAAEEITRLRQDLDAAQLRSIEERNPGIDMTEVKRIRGRRIVTEKVPLPNKEKSNGKQS